MHVWYQIFFLEARHLLCQAGNQQAEEDAKRVGQYSPSERVESPQQLAGRLLTTVYMGTVNSSQETKDRAASLARQVLPLCLTIASSNSAVWQCLALPQDMFGVEAIHLEPEGPHFKAHHVFCRLALIIWTSKLIQWSMPWQLCSQASLGTLPDSG